MGIVDDLDYKTCVKRCDVFGYVDTSASVFCGYKNACLAIKS